MTQNDDSSLSEDEMDEIVDRVVDRLREAGVGGDGEEDDIEGTVDEDDADGEHADHDGHADHGEPDPRAAVRERKREAERRAREARRRARERTEEFDELGEDLDEFGEDLGNLGEAIEAAVEAGLDGVAQQIERSLGAVPAGPPEPTVPGVVVGPGDTREKAVYKTQLQKGGRVAVPDTEIEALGLEPGDALQVVLYPVE